MGTPVEVTRRLAEFAAGIRSTDLPAEAVGLLKMCWLDFVGLTAYASRHADSGPAVLAAVRALGSSCGGPGTVVGSAETFAPAHAALLNGTNAHSFDFDDTNAYGTLHPGAPVIAAGLAAAESVGASGRELLVGLAAGYEVAARVGAALGETAYDRGFHPTGVAGIFGAVAAGARVLGLSERELLSAWGAAGSFASGSMQYLADGAWNKRVHPGWAAHAALFAVLLAKSGFHGADLPLEGRYGVLNAYGDAPRPELATAELGERWVLLLTAIKPYPSCRYTHAAVDAALMLRKRVGAAFRAGGTVSLRLSPYAHQIVGERVGPKLRPRNLVDAQFSVYFQVVAALLDGRVGLDAYAHIRDGEREDLTARVFAEPDPELPALAAVATYRSPLGEETTVRVDAPVGEPPEGMPWGAIEDKFHSLARSCFAEDVRTRIVTSAHELEGVVDLRPVLADLRTVVAR
ncbi:MmgE/PrpD family protein [Actinophytocola sp.]|uniref:MmgE/PrpD family protein n=1 Tax=Actinophytocola sp. TaxID=1872138 RepID=UPI003D6BF54C